MAGLGFYLAIDRLPLGTVGAIEFLGPVLLAAIGVRSRRNVAALVLAIAGVYLLTDIHLVDEPLGLALAFGNCVLFLLYVILGHRLAADGDASGIDRLAAAVSVGICSSVIPYVCDQLAMARLPRATFALMLSLLPATAVVLGVVVLGQIPTWIEAAGVALVIAGVAVHQERAIAGG